MVHISKIEISNFKSLRGEVIINNLGENMYIHGLFDTLKTDLTIAIAFAFDASLEDLQINELNDLRDESILPHHNTFVELTIMTNPPVRVCREIDDRKERWYIDHEEVTHDEYRNRLKRLGIDPATQFHSYMIGNHNAFWHMITTEQDKLIATLTNRIDNVKRFYYLDCERHVNNLLLEHRGKHHEVAKDSITSMQQFLPPLDQNYRVHLEDFIKSNLIRQETRRAEIKKALVTAQNDLVRNINDIATSQRTIDQEAGLIEQKTTRNLDLLTRIHAMHLTDNENVLSINLQILHAKMSVRSIDTAIENNRRLILNLQRSKHSTTENLRFMNRHRSGTNLKMNVVTDDALTKLYSVYHGSDELAKAKLQFQLMQKKDELNEIEHSKENYEFFDTIPERRMKEMDQPVDVREMFEEANNSLKGIFHPSSFIHPCDDVKFEYLRSLIPADTGFLLCDAVRAKDTADQPLIDHILCELKFMVVLYRDVVKSIAKKLKEAHAEWFRNVQFLVLASLPKIAAREEPNLNHWILYANIENQHADDEALKKLELYLTQKLNIECCDDQDTVKQEFAQGSKKYHASRDGQLIYKRSTVGIDVLMYFSPGEKVKQMPFPVLCKRLEDSLLKIGEWMSTLVETENIPRLPRDIRDPTDLQAEVDRLEEQIADKNASLIVQMENLRQKLARPYQVPEEQNYGAAIRTENQKFNEISNRIAEAQNAIAGDEAQKRNLMKEIDVQTDYIQLRTELDTNKKEIIQHNRKIKEAKWRMNNGVERKDQLKIKTDELIRKIRNVKYETIRTVKRGHQDGIHWANINCQTTPPTLWQDIKDGTFVDPMTISTRFVDMVDGFDEKRFYASGKWFGACDESRTKTDEQESKMKRSKDGLKIINDERERLRLDLTASFESFNKAITKILDDLCSELYPLENIVYKFKYDFMRPGELKEIIHLTIDGYDVGYEYLDRMEQLRTHWLVFAAFHHYCKAPIVFIDFSDVTDDIVRFVSPIVNQIARNKQLFVISSDVYHTGFSTLTFGMHKIGVSNGYNVVVARHDSREHISADGGNDEPDEASRERDGTVAYEDRTTLEQDGTVAYEDRTTLEQDEAARDQDETTVEQDGAARHQDEAAGDQDGTTVEQDEAAREREADTGDQDGTTSEQDEATRERDEATRERDGTTSEQDEAARDQDEAARERDGAAGDQDGTTHEQSLLLLFDEDGAMDI